MKKLYLKRLLNSFSQKKKKIPHETKFLSLFFLMQDSRKYSFPKVPVERGEFLVVFIGSMAFSREMHAAQERRNPAVFAATGSVRRDVPQRRRHENQPAWPCRRYRYEESVSRQCVSGTHVPFRLRFLLSARRELDGSN